MALPREVKHTDIVKGEIFYVALPHLEGRPFRFVEADKDNPDLFRIIEKEDGFEPAYDESGKKFSPELLVVSGIKLRPCLVISSDEMNQNEQYPLAIVLPIQTISSKQKDRPLFKRMVEKNDLPEYYYLDKGSYITINNPRRVYKNTLFTVPNKVNFDKSLIDLDKIFIRFAECFEIDKIRQCEECDKNCKNCELKVAVNE